jgi:flagellar motor protein MotB
LEQYIAQASRAAQEAAGEKAANQEMRAQLSADAGRFAELERRLRDEEQQLHEKQATLDKAQEELSTTQSALTQAQTRVDTTTASLAAAGSALSDTEKALEEQKASIERERELLANGREVRDIMGARNLHIVDVYDTDGKGHTRRAFGRAFYTQGKSLIFYAFDLPAEKADSSKYAFYAWGKNSGSPSSATHGLGIFYHDDQAQRRWVMEFSDPKVLNEIDTVFVTLEPKNKALHTPTGKPILDAYFGSPANHP